MLPLLDRHGRGAHLTDLTPRLDQAGFAGEFTGLSVVQNQHVDTGDQAEEFLLGDVDPEIHRVGDNEVGADQLVQHMVLKGRSDVAEEDHSRRAIRLGKIGSEVLEDIQLHRAGLALIHVPHVFAGPPEGFPRNNLQSSQINVPALEELDVLFWKVIPDDSHQIHRRKEARSDGSVGCGTAKQIGPFLDRGFDGI